MERPTQEQLEKGKRFLDRLAQSQELRRQGLRSQTALANSKTITNSVHSGIRAKRNKTTPPQLPFARGMSTQTTKK